VARPWGIHPGIAHGAAILANLERNSGRGPEAWLALAREAGVVDLKAARAYFRERGLGMSATGWLAEMAAGEEPETPESYLAKCPGYLDAQYAGARAALRPLLDRILDAAYGLGADVTACPCRTLVSVYRKRVFAEVKPFASRLDLGLVLGDPAKLAGRSPRLVDTGGFAKKDRITLKLEVRSAADLDGDLEGWLRRAYDLDA